VLQLSLLSLGDTLGDTLGVSAGDLLNGELVLDLSGGETLAGGDLLFDLCLAFLPPYTVVARSLSYKL